MAQQLLRRIVLFVPSLLGVITLAFLLIHLIPGDPIEIMLGEQASSANKQALRAQLGLDLPLPVQYIHFLKNTAQGDLGVTLRGREPVTPKLMSHVGATLELAAGAFGIAVFFGLILGVGAAVERGRWFDRFVLGLTSIGISMPTFWLAPILVYIFAIELNWFPVSERESLLSLVLPALTLSFGMMSTLARLTRASMLEVIGHDFIRTARAKGVSENLIYFKHVLRNALLPIATLIGMQLGSLMTGAVVTEAIFDWPGVGNLFYNAIQNRDYPVVQACVLFIAFVYLVINLLTDLSYQFIDPRLRR